MSIEETLKLHSEAELFITHILNRDKAWVFANPDFDLTDEQSSQLLSLIGQRKAGWPAAYLIGSKEFYGLEFKVCPDVLIPRPETEQLVELALAKIHSPASDFQNLIEIGTGSGCVAVSIARNVRTDISITATDVSDKALATARLNASRHNVLNKIRFLNGQLLKPIAKNWSSDNAIASTLILANLPYLKTVQLAEPTLKYEPRLALDGGPDGLQHHTQLFEQLHRTGAAKTTLLIEHNPDQKTKLQHLIKRYLPDAQTESFQDLADFDRILQVKIQ